MAADFMARRVRFLSSFFLLIPFIICSCTSSDDLFAGDKKVNKADGNFRNANGLMLLNDKPFTGMLFTLYPGIRDTLEINAYLEGAEHGIWKRFYPDGKLELQREFDRGKKTGEFSAFWQNRNRKLRYKFVNDEYQGLCQEWNPSGGLIKEMTYAKGHEEGPQKMFYDNGKVRSNYTVINGRRYGLLGTKNCVNVADSVFSN
jgi:antitoxin component YwqK of YwqJK toxin-antitoxin module